MPQPWTTGLDGFASIAVSKGTAKEQEVSLSLERVLNAPPGSLPIIDEQTVAVWFED